MIIADAIIRTKLQSNAPDFEQIFIKENEIYLSLKFVVVTLMRDQSLDFV